MKYSFEDYNEHNVLKIPLTLVLVNLYLLKHFFIFILPIISQIPWLVKFAHENFNLSLLLSSLPAVLVMVGMSRRLPKTRSPIIRWLWRQGRWLFLLNLVLEISLIILYVALEIKKFNEASLIFLYTDVVLIIFLFRSARVRDIFAEFPEKTSF